MKNKGKISFLHSLVDPFEYSPNALNSFEELGAGPQGEYHVAVFFRNVVASVLQIDYKNPIRSTKHSTLYNITNTGGTVYGLLFVVNQDKFRIGSNHMVIDGDKATVGDFSPFPFSGDKYSVSMYRDSADTLLVNVGESDSKLVVLDD
tara:strand:- start:77118 stop:77561 length:444 start_codon:yes stop_codon:yes gene_type:complete